MGFIFRKSFKVAPGVRLNVSKRGMGVSVGARNGPRVSVNSSGRVTKSVRLAPGLRWQETSTLGTTKKKRNSRNQSSQEGSSATQNELEQEAQLENSQSAQVNRRLEDLDNQRSLFLPHSIWSVMFFAIGGFISATQESYDKVAFFILAMAGIFALTYLWNLVSRDKD